jgi:hypothetical protein
MLEISQNFESNKCFATKNVRTIKDLDLPFDKIDVENLVQNFPYIRKAKLEGLNGILAKEVIQSNKYYPVFFNTELGRWVAHGPVSKSITTCAALVNICCEDREEALNTFLVEVEHHLINSCRLHTCHQIQMTTKV